MPSALPSHTRTTNTQNMPSPDLKFTSLGSPRRIWSISAIHGEAEKLLDIHDTLYEKFRPGDRLVYMGNYIGYGPHPCETIDELLTFRRLLLSMPGMKTDDIVYLRGGQEEMWQKLTQLQFAQDPANTLLWMLSKGLSSTLDAYGISPHDGIVAAQEGVMSLTRWTGQIREAVRSKPGHDMFSTQLRRAAFTPEETEFPLLFVHAGINPSQSLDRQGDSFWWAGKNFNDIKIPYNPFQKVIRGFDPAHEGMHMNCVTATIDGGCGFGGTLVCAGFEPDGSVSELLEA